MCLLHNPTANLLIQYTEKIANNFAFVPSTASYYCSHRNPHDLFMHFIAMHKCSTAYQLPCCHKSRLYITASLLCIILPVAFDYKRQITWSYNVYYSTLCSSLYYINAYKPELSRPSRSFYALRRTNSSYFAASPYLLVLKLALTITPNSFGSRQFM